MTAEFNLSGVLRRIRRRADLSQRELAAAAGLSASAVAHAEAGSRDLPVSGLVRAAAVARLRLALVDDDGVEVRGMTGEGARDRGYRRFPAHLDPMLSDGRTYWEVRKTRSQPTYTFGLDRAARDARRADLGTPDDHLVPQPGDSPAEREEARRRAAWRRREEAAARWLEAQRGKPFDPGWTCTCPPLCDELDDRNGKPVHADGCPCGCDVA